MARTYKGSPKNYWGVSGGVKMSEFYFRTESIQLENIQNLFVSTTQDREIINSLKSSDSVILEGSRGTGKSFLIRMAEVELENSFTVDRILPVYVTFVASSLIHTNDPEQFKHWMLASICYRLIRALRKKGLLIGASPATALLSSRDADPESLEQKFNKIYKAYEDSYKGSGDTVSPEEIPDLVHFKDAVEEICQDLNIRRICFLFDEAVHIFRPEQQRQFFTIFRDLRSPYISCKAAVYPGVTSYGNTFEISHDATYLRIERDILSDEYLASMKDIVLKQADENLTKSLNDNGANFTVLVYSASGNPRMLLKTVERCPKMRIKDVNEVIKKFYRTDIWTEHTGLGDKYKGHKALVDWGRNFIEDNVLPATRQKNETRAEHNESTCYFWIHRDVPETVKEALRLLEYTGIIRKNGEAVRATKSELGTRYELKFGCILSLEASPINEGMTIARNLTLQRVTEYGMNNQLFQGLTIQSQQESDSDLRVLLHEQLRKSIDILDLSVWLKNKLKEHKLLTIQDVLDTPEADMQNMMRYVGEKRARRISNAAIAEFLEYLSG
jgi:hypothetical protein